MHEQLFLFVFACALKHEARVCIAMQTFQQLATQIHDITSGPDNNTIQDQLGLIRRTISPAIRRTSRRLKQTKIPND